GNARQRRRPRGRGPARGSWVVTVQPAPKQTIPPLPPVEQYGPAMLRFALGAMRRAVRAPENTAHFVMVLTPWYRQAAAWFNVALGIAIAARTGARVGFLLNDMPYPAIHPDELTEIAVLDEFARTFEAMFPTRRLSRFLEPGASPRAG